MNEPDEKEKTSGMTEDRMRANLVRLVFGGDLRRYDEFCRALQDAIPLEAAAVVRGSSVTGERDVDGRPFDADGPGTSDVDLTLVGGAVLDWFTPEGFYLPGVHSKPLSEAHPDVAPGLVPLRERLSAMIGRPVNIQGTRDWMLFLKQHVAGQPYLTILGKVEPA